MKDTHQNTVEEFLPHQTNALFLMDGGLETSLIFHDGIELPYFAAFPLIETPDGRDALRRYFEGYLRVARKTGANMILETPTWRASSDWGGLLDYDAKDLVRVNIAAVDLLRALQTEWQTDSASILLSGCVGPRGDGYAVGTEMSTQEAQDYHLPQLRALRVGGVNMATALTMTYAQEAIGIARAATEVGVPIVVSFTVETDGRLPSGQALGEAIAQVDEETGSAPIYYMINCAHPTHFEDALKTGATWLARIGGVRANASRMSHAELDQAEDLDDGNPVEFGEQHRALRDLVPTLNVMGGCCGTDHRHVGHVAQCVCA